MKRLLIPVLVAVTSFSAAAAVAAVDGRRPQTPAPKGQSTATKTKVVVVKRWPRGARGPTGVRGARGATGPVGDHGAAGGRGAKGSNPVRVQSVAINWQNGQPSGRDRSTFSAPGIGDGEVVCNRDAQMVRFRYGTRLNGGEMWVARRDDRAFIAHPDFPASDKPFAVRAFHASEFTGKETNEGFNLPQHAERGQGSFTGLISDATALPTTFRLTYHWNFADGNPRCYVAGTFVTETP